MLPQAVGHHLRIRANREYGALAAILLLAAAHISSAALHNKLLEEVIVAQDVFSFQNIQRKLFVALHLPTEELALQMHEVPTQTVDAEQPEAKELVVRLVKSSISAGSHVRYCSPA
ncbi:MAG: hypothetical protein IPN44_11520 [Flavobacteriales bacterium]|nr:hypothetical protein [Flavobacteriales bacterium]